MGRRKKDLGKYLFLLFILLMVAALVGFRGGHVFSLWPGPEGLQAGVIGHYMKDRDLTSAPGYYGTDEQFPSAPADPEDDDVWYEWTQWPTVDPFNCRVKKYVVDGGTVHGGDLLVERSQPVADTSLAGRTIEYWVPWVDPDTGEEKLMKVIGEIVPWTFTVQVALKPPSPFKYHWPKFRDGEKCWFALGTVKWDRAYPDPDNLWKGSYAGWSIPLTVYIESYNPYGYWENEDEDEQRIPNTDWVSECVDITPDMDGRTVTLYDNPESPVTLDDLWYQGGLDVFGVAEALGMLNQTVGGDPSPDSRFANHAYFAITFNTFKSHVRERLGLPYEAWFPSVIYRLRVYYLQLGEFVYTQKEEELPWWDPRGWIVVGYDFWEGVFGFFGMLNPFAVFGPWAPLVAFIFMLLVLGVIVVVLLAVFAPWVLTRLFSGFGKARHAYKQSRKGG